MALLARFRFLHVAPHGALLVQSFGLLFVTFLSSGHTYSDVWILPLSAFGHRPFSVPLHAPYYCVVFEWCIFQIWTRREHSRILTELFLPLCQLPILFPVRFIPDKIIDTDH